MVYNEKMDKKLEEIISEWSNSTKQKMFGGTGYLINGNMVAGIHKDFYILRLGEKNTSNALKLPEIELFNMTGRAMKGWIMAEETAFTNKNDLAKWLTKAKQFVDTLPIKNKK